MKKRTRFALLTFLLFVATSDVVCSGAPPDQTQSQQAIRSETRLYRTAPEGELFLHIYYPLDWKADDSRPAIVFFFGGGWKAGSYKQFVEQAEYFASRGLVAMSADYRIKDKHRTTPDKSVEDAKSAIRWVRSHARELGVDADKIIAAGGSAGGHLAAATALLDDFDAAEDDASVSCRPSALVLFNPVLNLEKVPDQIMSKGGVGKLSDELRKPLSPTLYLKKTAPPAILFYGAEDFWMPQGEEYAAKAKEIGVRAELYVAERADHGFFNHSPWTEVTIKKADEFLESLQYLKGEPTVKLPASAPELKKR
jgi:acetyl esterase